MPEMRSKKEILDEMKTIPYDERDYMEIVEVLIDIRDTTDKNLECMRNLLEDIGREIRAELSNIGEEIRRKN